MRRRLSKSIGFYRGVQVVVKACDSTFERGNRNLFWRSLRRRTRVHRAVWLSIIFCVVFAERGGTLYVFLCCIRIAVGHLVCMFTWCSHGCGTFIMYFYVVLV